MKISNSLTKLATYHTCNRTWMFSFLSFFYFSFKSKRYRDKLRTEIKALECLIPVDRSSLHRKLDSQTVFRLVISFLRIKLLFKGVYLKTSFYVEYDIWNFIIGNTAYYRSLWHLFSQLAAPLPLVPYCYFYSTYSIS